MLLLFQSLFTLLVSELIGIGLWELHFVKDIRKKFNLTAFLMQWLELLVFYMAGLDANSERYIWQTQEVKQAAALKHNYLGIWKVHFKILSDKLQILFQGTFQSKWRVSTCAVETLVTFWHSPSTQLIWVPPAGQFFPRGTSRACALLVWRHPGAQWFNLTLTKKLTQLSPRRLFVHVRSAAPARAQLPVFTCSWRTLRGSSLRAGGGQLLA